MTLKLITRPTNEPVNLDEVKNHLRITNNDEDVLITEMIIAAREYCEAYQNRSYITQTWELWLDNWPKGNSIRIPRPPLQDIESVKYFGADGAEYTMPTNDYYMDNKSEPGRVVLAYNKSWPSTLLRPANAIAIKFISGEQLENVSGRIKQAIKLLIAHWYENREATLIGSISKEVEFSISSLLWIDRVVPI